MEDAKSSGSGQRADAAHAQRDEPPLSVVQVKGSPKYIIKEKLGGGGGGFGQVYVGESTGARDKVAVKFELISGGRPQKSPNEWEVYKALHGIDGVPRMYYNGTQGNVHITIMDLVGPSLRDLRKNMPEKLTDEFVKDTAIQAISILEGVHKRGYVHRNIEPGNLLLGPPGTSERKLFLTDFVLATRWGTESLIHFGYDQQPSISSLLGTVDYAGVDVHLGRRPSRRGDLESLAYTLIFLHRGQLPWHEHDGDNREFLVCKHKLSTPPLSLFCGLPQALREFFAHVVELAFDECPNYTGCVSLFKGIGRPIRSIPHLPPQVRTGKPATQWISVYDTRQPMEQRYHYGVETVNLAHLIEEGKEENLLISSVASCNNLWTLIIDDGTGFSHQIHEHLPSFPDEFYLKGMA